MPNQICCTELVSRNQSSRSAAQPKTIGTAKKYAIQHLPTTPAGWKLWMPFGLIFVMGRLICVAIDGDIEEFATEADEERAQFGFMGRCCMYGALKQTPLCMNAGSTGTISTRSGSLSPDSTVKQSQTTAIGIKSCTNMHNSA